MSTRIMNGNSGIITAEDLAAAGATRTRIICHEFLSRRRTYIESLIFITILSILDTYLILRL